MSDALFAETDEAGTSFLGFLERIGGSSRPLAASIFLGIIRMSRHGTWTNGSCITLWDGFFPDFDPSFLSARASSLTARKKSSSTVFRSGPHETVYSSSPGVLPLDYQACLAMNTWNNGRRTNRGGVPFGSLGSLERFNGAGLAWIARWM